MIIEHPSEVPWGQIHALYMDWPWQYRVWKGQRTRTADAHYPTLTLAAGRGLPIYDLMSDDSMLFFWITMPYLVDGIAMVTHWGFEFKTCAFTWVKRTTHGKWHVGLGHYTRANAELCLLFTKGKPRRHSKSVRQLIEAPIGKHSAKPHEIYQRIEELTGPGIFLEMFARNEQPGWLSMGIDLPAVGQGRDVRYVLGRGPDTCSVCGKEVCDHQRG
jgi:N6-adenosine-specific RNA methylase IME4